MKHIILLLSLLIPATGYGAGATVKKIGERANVRASEAGGTTTLVYTDAKEQIFNLSAARTVKLPTTGVKAGDKWILKNISTVTTAILTIQSSGANTLGVNNSADASVNCTALQDTPTTAAHWKCFLDFSPRTYLCDVTGGVNDIAYNNSVKATMSGANVSSVTKCILIPYQSLDGTWRFKHNSYYISPGVQVTDYSIIGIAINQQFSCSAGQMATGSANPAAASAAASPTILVRAGASGTAWSVSCDVELASRPTWAY